MSKPVSQSDILHMYAIYNTLKHRTYELDTSGRYFFRETEFIAIESSLQRQTNEIIDFFIDITRLPLNREQVDLKIPFVENMTIEYLMTTEPEWIIHGYATGVRLDSYNAIASENSLAAAYAALQSSVPVDKQD